VTAIVTRRAIVALTRRMAMSERHMPKYLAEFEYRMNLRQVPKLVFDLMLFVPGTFAKQKTEEWSARMGVDCGPSRWSTCPGWHA